MALYLLVLGAYVVAGHTAGAARGLVQTGEHVHGSGLAGTVGAQETEYLATANGKTDVVDGMETAEGFHQMLHFYHILALRGHRAAVADAGGIEDGGKLSQYGVGRADAAHLALVQKGHTVATAHLVEIGRGGDDGDAALAELTQHVPELLARHGVYTGGGLVEHKHAGLVDKGAREGELLLHAARKGTGTAVGEALYLAVDGLDGVVAVGHGGTEEGGEEVEVLPHGEVLVQ